MKNFKDLAPHSKVWIYQTNRVFNENEIAEIENSTHKFLQSWQSHGADMDASFHIFHNRFLVVALDETSAGASGCGIDKLFRHIKDVEQKLSINFFDRLIIYYLNSNVSSIYDALKEEEIHQTHFSKIDTSNITANSFIFDNTVTTKAEMEQSWISKVSNSWLAQHISNKETA